MQIFDFANLTLKLVIFLKFVFKSSCWIYNLLDIEFNFGLINVPHRGWADPGGTAIPGQPLTGSEQAPGSRREPKISLIFWAPYRNRIRY